MAALRLVDSHVHLWDPALRPYPWLAEHPAINEAHGIDHFDAACGEAQIEKLVFVECTGAFDDAVARDEVRWVHTIAAREPRLQGLVAHASLEKSAGIRPHLQWLAEQPLVRGVRRLLQQETDLSFCLQSSFVEGVRLLAEFDLTFDVCVVHEQLPAVIELVRQCPEVQFVLDHFGKPAIRNGTMRPWRDHIRALAECPNVVCKVSGALTEADPDAWTPGDIRPYLEHVIQTFGFDRVMFGGDWPVLKLAGTYPEWVDLVHDTVSGCTDAEQRQLFHETAARVYRLDN